MRTSERAMASISRMEDRIGTVRANRSSPISARSWLIRQTGLEMAWAITIAAMIPIARKMRAVTRTAVVAAHIGASTSASGSMTTSSQSRPPLTPSARPSTMTPPIVSRNRPSERPVGMFGMMSDPSQHAR